VLLPGSFHVLLLSFAILEARLHLNNLSSFRGPPQGTPFGGGSLHYTVSVDNLVPNVYLEAWETREAAVLG
jgi:hypothetical protein